MTIREFADVAVIREEWNTYKLPNGTMIKSKNSIAAFQIDRESKLAEGKFASTNVVIPCDEDKGPPSQDITVKPEDVLEEVPFEAIGEIINIYEVPKFKRLILVKPNVKQILKTRKFDKNGVRIFQLNSVIAIADIPYPELEAPMQEDEKHTNAMA